MRSSTAKLEDAWEQSRRAPWEALKKGPRKRSGRLVFVALILAAGPVGRETYRWLESIVPQSEREREKERATDARRAAHLADCERRAAELDAAERES